MEQALLNRVRSHGPQTGWEIKEALGADGLLLWRACHGSRMLRVVRVGRRYLRLDRRLDPPERLSPSMYREFLTYSVVGERKEPEALEQRASALRRHIEGVSRSKLDLIYHVVSALARRLEPRWPPEARVCFILGGDIVHNMAHDVPRPERSTGRLVRGSDMDLVVVTDPAFPEPLFRQLDESLYEEKRRILLSPHLREEIDYVVKRLSKVEEQVRMEDFRHLLACKILQEGTYLWGSETLFTQIKQLLKARGVTERLAAMEQRAIQLREEAEAYLLREDPARIRAEGLHLFYPAEESEEFE